MNNFEKASRMKLRFKSEKGLVTTEDLWVLPLTKVDSMAIAVKNQLKDATQDSFLSPSKTDVKLQLQLDILKHVIETRVAEQEAEKEIASKRLFDQKIKGILEMKKDAELMDKSIADLEKLLS